MRNVADESIEKFKTRFMFHNFFSENCAVYEIMCKNILDPDRARKTIWRMRNACLTTNATNTHPVTLVALPLQ